MLFNFKGMTREELVVSVQKLMRRQVLAALVLLILVFLFFGGRHAYLFLMGLVWALADTSLVFYSTLKGMNSTPVQTKRLLRIMFITRLALAVILVFIVLRMKLGLLEVLLGFVLMHIVFVWNLSNFTGRKQQDKKAVVRKGEKEDGSC